VAAVRREVSYQFLDDTSATASSLRKDGFWTVHTEPGAEPLGHDMQDHWQCPGTYRHAQGTAAHRGMPPGGVR
jgi:hypothetical protein